jgi:replicative DNA helicase
MEAVLARSLEPHHFLQRKKGDTSADPLPGEVFDWMCGHIRTQKAVPSYDLTQHVFPKFEFYETSDPLESIVEQMVIIVKRRLLIESLREAAAVADDPAQLVDAELILYSIASELARAVPSSNVTRLSDSKNRIEKHRLEQATDPGMGISLVLPELDYLTHGLQRHELMIWEGFLNIGKSSIAMAQSALAYVKQNKTSLVFALEMEGEKLAHRWDSMMSGFQYMSLKKMELKDDDYEKWARFADRAFDARFEKDIIVIDDIHRATPERIYAEVEKWKPDFSVVDTIDELRAPANLKQLWEQQAYAARELKGVCRATKRPIVGIAQAGRGAEEDGATLGNIAGSIDIARKADIVIGMHANPAMKATKQMELRALKVRDGDGNGQSFKYFWDVGAMEFRPWTPADNAPPPPPRQVGPPNSAVPAR